MPSALTRFRRSARFAIVVTAGLLSGAVEAHPHHDEDAYFEEIAASLQSQGKECDEVLEVEDTAATLVITCRIGPGDGRTSVTHTLPKGP